MERLKLGGGVEKSRSEPGTILLNGERCQMMVLGKQLDPGKQLGAFFFGQKLKYLETGFG